MPKIPTYTATIDYKPARGDLETAAMPGQALARFGEAVGEFGGKLSDYLKAREKKSEAESRQAAYDTRLADVEDYVKSARAESERANGTARMMDALHRDIADFDSLDSQAAMERDWTKAFRIRDDIVGAIGDPAARAAVESDTAGIAGLHVAMMRGGEVRRLSRDGRQDLDRNLALYGEIADNARHPLEFDEAMTLAVGEIRRKAAAGFITDEDAAILEQTFYADVAERQVRRAIAADPQGTLAGLESGEDFATLPAARRARLTEEAARAVQDQAVARTTAAAADRRSLEIRLPGFVTALRDGQRPDDGDEVSRDSLIAAFGDQDGARRWAELEEARAFGQQTIRIKWAPPDEIARLLHHEPDADAPHGTASAPSLLRQAVERRNQQLWAQPADYALANPRIAELHDALGQAGAQPKLPAALTAALQASGAPAPAAAVSDEGRHAATAAYANATLAEQERLGLPADRRQVLPAAQAQELVARILDGDTKAAADTLRDLIATWGEAAPTALADLSRHGLPGGYRLLASLTEPAARQTFAKVLTAQAAEPGVLRGKVGDEAETIDGLLRLYNDRLLMNNRIDGLGYQDADDVELAQTNPSQTTEDDQPYSTVKRSSNGVLFPPSRTPRPRGGFGGPKVTQGQKETRRDIEPKPPANLSPAIAETLKGSRLTPVWRDAIGRLETHGRPYNGYGTSLADVNSQGREGYALGRYQMRRDVLIENGLMTQYEEWTGKYGIRSWQDFLNNPQAQEAALVDWSESTDRYIRARHASHLNRQITGIKSDIAVTESGLAAAIHREGTGRVSGYFRWLDRHGWNSRDHQAAMQALSSETRRSYLAIETRLREFQNIPYKSR